MQAPCKKCEKRKMGCHSVCPSYLEYKKQIEAVHEKERLSNLYPSHNNFGVSWEKYKKQWKKKIKEN